MVESKSPVTVAPLVVVSTKMTPTVVVFEVVFEVVSAVVVSAVVVSAEGMGFAECCDENQAKTKTCDD